MSTVQQSFAQPYSQGNSSYDPYYDNVSLLLPLNGVNGSTSFVDDSPNQKTVTINGSMQISTAQSKFGGSSALFSGSPSYLNVPDSNDLELGSSNFTIECWVYWTGNVTNWALFRKAGSYELYMDDTRWVWQVNTVTNVFVSPSNQQPTIGVWYHIALVRNGRTTTLYINGTGTYSGNSVDCNDNTNLLDIGFGARGYLTGYMDDARITKGIARYTSNFTPLDQPNPRYGAQYDDFYNNVSLLLHCNGTNSSTNFIDNSGSPKTVTANGNTQISTAQWKFGGSSAYFDGSGDYLQLPYVEDWSFGTGDFTIEMWVYIAGNSSLNGDSLRNATLISSHATSGTTTYGYSFNISGNSTTTGTGISFNALNNTTWTTATATYSFSQNTWYHIAASKSSGTMRIFVNGISQTFTTNTLTSSITTTDPLRIATNLYTNYNNDLNGYIDDLRITKGIARYTSDFTPPRNPFPNASNIVDPYYTNVSLLLPCNGGNASTSFIDSSPTSKIVTANGGAQISTAQWKFGGSSAYFDGVGDWLSIPNNTDLNLVGVDFTIEAWIYYTQLNTGNMQIVNKDGNASFYPSYSMSISSTGKLNGLVANSTGVSVINLLTSTATISANTWTHVAFTRSGSTLRIFINGTIDQTSTQNITMVDSARAIGIGWQTGYANGDTFYGYIDDLRITKGVARYTQNFTPPVLPNPTTGQFVDNYYNNVSLLLHMNGSNSGTSFVDSSPVAKAVTANGNAVTSTTQYKYGTSSAYFDGNGDWLSVPSNSDFDFGSSNFTIEMWVYFTNTSVGQNVFGKYLGSGTSPYAIYMPGGGSLAFFASSNGTTWDLINNLIIISSVSINTWYNIAITRSGNIFRTFNNGVLVSTSGSISSALVSNSANLTIGGGGVSDPYFYGYLDDLRITKGVARYTQNFTPPVQAFPDNSPTTDPFYYNTSLLLHFDGTNTSTNFVDNSPVIKSITANGNAQISTTQSKFGGSSAYFDGSGDYLSIARNAAFLPVANEDFTIETWVYLTAVPGAMPALIAGLGEYGTDSDWNFQINSSLQVSFYINAIVTTFTNTTAPITLNSWNHVAVSRAGTGSNNLKVFVNGIGQSFTTNSTTVFSGNRALTIGADQNGDEANLTGYIDDFRITKGVARYVNNFSPPQRAFPNQ